MKEKLNLTIVFILLKVSVSMAQIDVITNAIGGLTGGKTNVVYDPTNKVQLAKVIAESKKTNSAIQKQLELLDKAREAMARVDEYVRQIQYIDDIKNIQMDINRISQESIDASAELKVINDTKIIALIGSINANLVAVESMLNLANHIIEDGFLKMSSGERIDALYKIRAETLGYRATAIYLNQQIRDIASLKLLNKIYGGTN